MKNNAVYKYEVHALTTQLVGMPKGAELLSVASQGEKAFVWAKVDLEAPTVGRKLAVFRTGEAFPAELGQGAYVGRIDFAEGPFGPMVFHVFDYGEESS